MRGGTATFSTDELELRKDGLVRLCLVPFLALIELAIGNEVIVGLRLIRRAGSHRPKALGLQRPVVTGPTHLIVAGTL